MQRLTEEGFRNVSSVSFEHYTLEEQMQIAQCTDLLIGVQGMALVWSVLFIITIS